VSIWLLHSCSSGPCSSHGELRPRGSLLAPGLLRCGRRIEFPQSHLPRGNDEGVIVDARELEAGWEHWLVVGTRGLRTSRISLHRRTVAWAYGQKCREMTVVGYTAAVPGEADVGAAPDAR